MGTGELLIETIILKVRSEPNTNNMWRIGGNFKNEVHLNYPHLKPNSSILY